MHISEKTVCDIRHRAMVGLQHGGPIAWMTFDEHRDALLNRQVSVKLRLKFVFVSVITPIISFVFLTCPFTLKQLQQLDVVSDRLSPLLHSIVTWAPLVGSDWHVCCTT